jgi:alkyl hydroperoxide reductase subunit D
VSTAAGLEQLRESIPELAKDTRLNLGSVLQSGPLSPAQRWGVAIASAAASRSPRLASELAGAARGEGIGEEVIEDALAAATLMAMNNVYYRFRHVVDKPSYETHPPRLRMARLGRPAAAKVDMELFALAVSAINDCATCVRAHEKVVTEGGLTEEQVHDAIRIAAVIHAAAVSLDVVGISPRALAG